MNQNTKTNGDILVELTEANCYTRWPCHACGGTTEKVSILAEVKTGEYEGFRVCEQCLKAGEDAIEKSMSEYAVGLVRQAATLRGMIGRLKVPTYQEWEEAVEAFEERCERARNE